MRRRLFVCSAPVALVLLLAAAKMIVVSVVGSWAATDFSNHDTEALRRDVAWLRIVDVIEPAKSSFAAGGLHVLEGRLQDADDSFSEALSRTAQAKSCPVRINLLLVRETRGDLAARRGNKDEAQRFYEAALESATQAPANCFAGNDDRNKERRVVREDAVPRLHRKIDLLRRPAAPPAPDEPPPPGAPPPGPPPSAPQLPPTGGVGQNPAAPGVLIPISPDRLPVTGGTAPPGHRLGTGDPLDLLRQLLDDSNSYGDNQE
ncbi:hypothetical protein A5636_04890 [Mycobacterium asiaticum]|uniref:Tetratricopeptide repeat protein n=1 Tax=Mycobacterium asiaticum TaxID=1790 RepID=A0A1A3N1V6_MYCAS|nr:hypothetical protein A5636_04890 [Mycobacterium asiaticum]